MSRSHASAPLAHRVAAIACASVVLVAGCASSTPTTRPTSAVTAPSESAGASAGGSASASASGSATASEGAAPSTTAGEGLNLGIDRHPALKVIDLSGTGKVLADENGMVVYQDADDPSDSSSCIEQCATTWPPLLIAAGTTVSAGTDVTGTIGSITRPDGATQVTSDGHPLYFYFRDPKPMVSKGIGVSPDWSVVTP